MGHRSRYILSPMASLAEVMRHGMGRAREASRKALARLDGHSNVGWPDERPAVVEAMLTDHDIPFRRWDVPVEEFRAYMDRASYPDTYLGGRNGGDPFFLEKALEHFVSLALADPQPGEVVVDVASNGSPFLANARALHGVAGYEQDLQYPRGISGDRIGGDAADMPVPDGFADVMTLHCSYDHFEGDADVGFARESGRVLKPGGRVVIVPLYLATAFVAKVDPRLRLSGLRLDRGMTKHLIPGLDVRFSRVYDAARLHARVLNPAQETGLAWEVLRVQGFEDVVPNGYLNFALILRKQR